MSRTGSFIKSEFIPTQCSCWRFTEVLQCANGFCILSLVELKETYRFNGKEKCLGKCLLDDREGNWVILFKIDSTTRRGNVEGDVTKVFWNGVLDLENSQRYTWVGEGTLLVYVQVRGTFFYPTDSGCFPPVSAHYGCRTQRKGKSVDGTVETIQVTAVGSSERHTVL